MEFVRKNQIKESKNNDTCSVFEYPMEDKDIDGALVNINGVTINMSISFFQRRI